MYCRNFIQSSAKFGSDQEKWNKWGVSRNELGILKENLKNNTIR